MPVFPAHRGTRPRLALALLTAALALAHVYLLQSMLPGSAPVATGQANTPDTPPGPRSPRAAMLALPQPATARRPAAPRAATAQTAAVPVPSAQPPAQATALAAEPAPQPAGPGGLLVPAPTPAGTSPGALDTAFLPSVTPSSSSPRVSSPPSPHAPVAPTGASAALAAVATASAPHSGLALASAAAATPAAIAAAPGTAWPTEVPPSAHLTYLMRRGSLSGTGELSWHLEGGQYQLKLEGRLPIIGSILTQASQGVIDRYGLAPTRHTESRLKRSERSVNFVRHANGRGDYIAFSASTQTEPLHPGAQDSVSWMPQLAARLAAWPASHSAAPHPPAGTVLAMDVASVRGSVRRWNFRMLDVTPEGWLHLQRDPESEHDNRSEVWMDPQRHSWPVRVVSVENSGETIELILRELQPR